MIVGRVSHAFGKRCKKVGFECLGYECEGEQLKIWCKLCKEYSEFANVSQSKKGVAKVASETFVKGTSVIKKNNFAEHVKKSITHANTVARLCDHRKQKESEQLQDKNASTSSDTSATEAPCQATLMPYITKLNEQQQEQLTKKMQLAHLTAINAKPFCFYGTLAKFCKDTLKVSKIAMQN